MVKKLEDLINKELNIFNDFFIKKFNSTNYNQKHLKIFLYEKVFLTSHIDSQVATVKSSEKFNSIFN